MTFELCRYLLYIELDVKSDCLRILLVDDAVQLSHATKRKIDNLDDNATKMQPACGKIVMDSEMADDTSTIRSSKCHKSHFDGRKYNKGARQRKSYALDFKKRAIAMRKDGLCIQTIAMTLGTAKSNIEKWCSVKVRTPIVCFFQYIQFFCIM